MMAACQGLLLLQMEALTSPMESLCQDNLLLHLEKAAQPTMRHTSSRGTRPPTKYHVVSAGRRTGLFRTWHEAEQATRGYSGARHKAFKLKRMP
jgi:hypothetical protein